MSPTLGVVGIFGFLLLLAAIYRILGRLFWVNNWRQKAVFITGCDSGFGKSLALTLSSKGVTVFAGCLTQGGAEALRNVGGTLFPIIVDITSDESMGSARRKVKEVLKAKRKLLWGVVCNAGVEKLNAPDDWLSMDHYREHMEVNAFGTLRTVRSFKDLVKGSRGRIVIMTSIKGRLMFPDSGPYTMAKYAMEAYVDLIRRELSDFGVGVSGIQPGGFQTNIVDGVAKNLAEVWSELPSAIKEEYGEEFFQNKMDVWTNWSGATQSPNLAPVVAAYSEALFSRFPRARYVVGWDSWLSYLPASYLPEFLQDLYVTLSFPGPKPKVALKRSKKNC